MRAAEPYTLSLHDALPIFDDMVAAVATQHLRHTESAARSDDADNPLFRERYVWPTERSQMLTTDTHRSEEHTSELQSHVNLVCRLLLDENKQIVCAHV